MDARTILIPCDDLAHVTGRPVALIHQLDEWVYDLRVYDPTRGDLSQDSRWEPLVSTDWRDLVHVALETIPRVIIRVANQIGEPVA